MFSAIFRSIYWNELENDEQRSKSSIRLISSKITFNEYLETIENKSDLKNELLNRWSSWKLDPFGLNPFDKLSIFEGQTPLLAILSSSKQHLDLVSLLLNYAGGIGINEKDIESGYTALHKSLLKGFLRTALLILKNSNVGFEVKDHEGLTSLDLLDATIKLPTINNISSSITRPNLMASLSIRTSKLSLLPQDPEPPICPVSLFSEPSSSFSIYTWGSNSNYLLGTGLLDSRTIPDIMAFKTGNIKIAFKNVLEEDLKIVNVCMSKYHVAVLSSSNILTYGFGNGGRLGNGAEMTLMTPTVVSGLPASDKPIHVALGPDHSLAILFSGRVFTWGDNRMGVLGFKCEKKTKPEEVRGIKGRVTGGACSKYHSCVFTNKGDVYTWGSNCGQLGYVTSSDASDVAQMTPRKVTNLPSIPVVQVACTSSTTLLLLETHEITIMTNYKIASLNCGGGVPLSICAGAGVVGVVFKNGDVGVWESPGVGVGDGEFFLALRIVWKARRKKGVAIKCAVGINGSLLIVTERGHVYHQQIRSSTQKFVKIPNLEHIVKVAASSGGSFAAIRSDFRNPPPVKAYPCPVDVKNSSEVDFENIVVRLKDGKLNVAKHILIRSDFFKAMLTLPGSWKIEKTQDKSSLLDLTGFGLEVFEVVVKWLETGSEDMFGYFEEDGVEKICLEDWINLVSQTLIISDFLLIPGAVSICSCILSRFITLENCLYFLEQGIKYNANELRASSLDFLVRNLETVLRRGWLQECSEELVCAVEECLQKLQIDKIPLVLGPGGIHNGYQSDETLITELRLIEAEELNLKRLSHLPLQASALTLTGSPVLSPQETSRKQPPPSPLMLGVAFPVPQSPLSFYSPPLTHMGQEPESRWIESKQRRKTKMPNSGSGSFIDSAATSISSTPSKSSLSTSIGFQDQTSSGYLGLEFRRPSFSKGKEPSIGLLSPTTKSSVLEQTHKRISSIDLSNIMNNSTPPKLSQRERKKAQHQQTNNNAAAGNSASPIPAKAWSLPHQSSSKSLLEIQKIQQESIKETVLLFPKKAVWGSPSKNTNPSPTKAQGLIHIQKSQSIASQASNDSKAPKSLTEIQNEQFLGFEEIKQKLKQHKNLN